MKKAVTLFCMVCLTLSSFAQEKICRFGLKGGFNHSWLSDNYLTNTHRNSFHAGVLVNFRLNEHWHLQPETYFSAQGEVGDNKEEGVSPDYNYIVMPIMVQYRFRKGFYLEAGPQVGGMINKRSKILVVIQEYPYKDNNVNTFDVMIAIGAGYQINRHIAAYVRANQGVTNVRASTLAKKGYNEVLQLGASYLF